MLRVSYYKALVSVIQLEAEYRWDIEIAVHLCSWVDA